MLNHSTLARFRRLPVADQFAWASLAFGLFVVTCVIARLTIGPYGQYAPIFGVIVAAMRYRRPVRTVPANGPLPSWLTVTDDSAELVAVAVPVPPEPVHAPVDTVLVAKLYDACERAERAESKLSRLEHSAKVARDAIAALAKADQTAAKWQSKYRDLRGRVYKRRERRLGELARNLRGAERRHSLTRLIRTMGGISRDDDTVKTVYGTWKDAISDGLPKSLFVKSRNSGHQHSRQSLEEMAEQLAADGVFTLPPDRHAPDYLLELLAGNAVAHTGDEGELYEIRAELEAVESEHGADDLSFNVESF
jgi:hypothetical protein